MHKNILFISYLFSEENDVGSARARALARFLKSKDFNLTIIANKKTKSKFHGCLWLLKTLFIISTFKGSNIYLTVGPFFYLLPISIICKITRKKLVVDFRDPWSLNILTNYGEYKFSNQLHKTWKFKLSALIEKITYQSCKSFVVCTQGMKIAYERLFNDSSKILIIENGYTFNHELFNNNNNNNNKDCLQFVCVGKFAEYGLDKAKEVLKKIITIQEKKHVKLLLIGTNREINEPLITQLGLKDITTFIPQVSYPEALNYIAESNIGLALIRNDYFEYGTKVFDYIGVGLPFISNASRDSNFHARFSQFILNDSLSSVSFTDKDRKNSHRNSQFQKFIEIFK